MKTADYLIPLCNIFHIFWVRMHVGLLPFKDTTIFLQSRNGMKCLFVKLLMFNMVIKTGCFKGKFHELCNLVYNIKKPLEADEMLNMRILLRRTVRYNFFDQKYFDLIYRPPICKRLSL